MREISFLKDRSAVKILSDYVSMRAISINHCHHKSNVRSPQNSSFSNNKYHEETQLHSYLNGKLCIAALSDLLLLYNSKYNKY